MGRGVGTGGLHWNKGELHAMRCKIFGYAVLREFRATVTKKAHNRSS